MEKCAAILLALTAWLKCDADVEEEDPDEVRIRLAGDTFLGVWAKRLRSFMYSKNKKKRQSDKLQSVEIYANNIKIRPHGKYMCFMFYFFFFFLVFFY